MPREGARTRPVRSRLDHLRCYVRCWFDSSLLQLLVAQRMSRDLLRPGRWFESIRGDATAYGEAWSSRLFRGEEISLVRIQLGRRVTIFSMAANVQYTAYNVPAGATSTVVQTRAGTAVTTYNVGGSAVAPVYAGGTLTFYADPMAAPYYAFLRFDGYTDRVPCVQTTFPTTVVNTSGAGSPVVRAFPFAYNSPGLRTGHAVYTPTVGDVLLDAWIEVDIAWDGTTPKCDVGTFLGAAMFASIWDALDMTNADQENFGAGILLGGGGTNKNWLLSAGSNSVAAGAFVRARGVPGKFTAATPIKVVVSQDGSSTGADPGSTQGSAILYLVTATPA